MSAAVSTARTPGSALALLVSMRMILAWACGLRRSFACSMPRGLMSATYWTWPVTFSGSVGSGNGETDSLDLARRLHDRHGVIPFERVAAAAVSAIAATMVV